MSLRDARRSAIAFAPSSAEPRTTWVAPRAGGFSWPVTFVRVAAPPTAPPSSPRSASDFVATHFGERFRHVYGQQELKEMRSFHREVTTLEYDWYLRQV